MSRTIVHLDADAFFASVEQSADSRLRGKPIAVGGECRVPLTRAKGLTDRTIKRLLAEREREVITSLGDFHRRVNPSPEELELMIHAAGFDEFGEIRTRQFWAAQQLQRTTGKTGNLEFNFDGATDPVSDFFADHPGLLCGPKRRKRLEAETELFSYAVGRSFKSFRPVAEQIV